MKKKVCWGWLSYYAMNLMQPVAETPLNFYLLSAALPKACSLLVLLQHGQLQLPGESITLQPSRSSGSNPGWTEAGVGLNFGVIHVEFKGLNTSGVNGDLPIDSLGAKAHPAGCTLSLEWIKCFQQVKGRKGQERRGEIIPRVHKSCPWVPTGIILTLP